MGDRVLEVSRVTDERASRTVRASERNRSGVLVVMCVGYFLVLLDVTIVNVALPHIGSGLHAGVSALQWVVDGYAIALASLMLTAGTLGDLRGLRRVVLAGLALFGAGSLGCGLAPSTAPLIAARVVQGIGAALLLPGTLAVITHAFPDRREQARGDRDLGGNRQHCPARRASARGGLCGLDRLALDLLPQCSGRHRRIPRLAPDRPGDQRGPVTAARSRRDGSRRPRPDLRHLRIHRGGTLRIKPSRGRRHRRGAVALRVRSGRVVPSGPD
jgi:MFS transporter